MEHEEIFDNLLAQSRTSRFRGVTGDADLVGRGRNPLCGDEIQLGMMLDGELVRELHFDGPGCIVSQGAAAMLCERVSGRRIEEVVGSSAETLLGFDPAVLTMNRQRCARLAYEILQELLCKISNEERPSAKKSIDFG